MYANPSYCYPSAYYCSSGCCSLSGYCANYFRDCAYLYSDYYSNSYKYSFYDDYRNNSKTTVNVGGLAGGIAGGVVVLIIIIVAICIWRRRKAQMNMMNANTVDGTTVIISTNPNQNTFPMTQPYANDMGQQSYANNMQQPYQQTYPPVYQ